MGLVALVVLRLQAVHATFETDARIVHRLLSQKAAQHDTMLATLNLLSTDTSSNTVMQDGPGAAAAQAEQRLPALYPQVLAVQRRERGQAWPTAALQQADALSRRLGRAVLADVELAHGRYTLVQAGAPVSHTLHIDLNRLTPVAPDWTDSSDGAARYALQLASERRLMQPGRPTPWAWHVELHKPLASASQAFELVAERWLGVGDLPWLAGGVWLLFSLALLAAMRAWHLQRLGQHRAEELLRLGQVARLNTLGELAAGMAHELNQPLTAVLSSTQAALRVLADEPPDVELVRQAMRHAVAQASRASEVLKRLRRMVERPGSAAPAQALSLQDAVRDTLQLLDPQARSRQVTLRLASAHDTLSADAPAHADAQVRVDPVALQQVLHNLVMNGLQALEQVPVGTRELTVCVGSRAARGAAAGRRPPGGADAAAPAAVSGVIEVRDSGPGIAPDALPRLFEPFYTTRAGGLGLGLSLCETLVTAMGGQLSAANRSPRGAVFTLILPLVQAPPPVQAQPRS